MKQSGILYIIIFIVILAVLLQAQNRYESEIFSTYQLQNNIQYGRSITMSGSAMDLMLDIYKPSGDTLSRRPLVIFIHGGGFKDGDKVSNFGTLVCGGLSKRGYLVASINYRLGTANTDKSDYEAMLRAVQDGKAAVRFFRRFSAQYGVDTNHIYVTGSSAGSITALHMAYLDQNEIPSYVDLSAVGGSLEGTSGSPGYSSRIHGVISNWGALVDYKYIQKGDVPVYCVHGLADATVPCDSSFGDGPFKYGSIIINNYAQSLGVKTGIRLFANTGHTLDNSTAKQDSAYKDFSKWLYSVLTTTTGVNNFTNNIPETFRVEQNYPNPFNPSTKIKYSIPRNGNVEISIYDISGKRISLFEKSETAGEHEYCWNLSAENINAASGVYLCRVRFENKTSCVKMLLMK